MRRLTTTLAVVCTAMLVVPAGFAQVPDTAAAIERLRQEMQAGRISPDEIRARIQAAGLTADQVRQKLREAGYPANLLDQYLVEGGAVGAPSLTSDQLEQVLRRLSVPPLESDFFADTFGLGPDTLALDSALAPMLETGPPIFGRSLFERATTQFQSLTMGPVPENYRLGPGDELVLILTGDVQQIYTLPVTREGFVVIPNVGRVAVNGLTMAGLREALYTYLGGVYSGVRRGPEATTHFEVSISSLRRNQVYVVGEVESPGAYEVTSVSTAMQALYQAGGPTENGSFRNIEIRRGDERIAVLDVYEYLTEGSATGDVSLDQGDVVFVPVRSRRVWMEGDVIRPGIYELKGREGLRRLLELAGGIEPEADLRRVQIDRILPLEERRPGVSRTLIDVQVAELLDEEGELIPLVPGDRVYVFAVSDERRNTVTIRGNVWHPGVYEYSSGMTLSRLIDRAGGLKDDTYLGRAQIIRLDPRDLSQRVVPVSLTGDSDPALQEYDEVAVYSVAEFRDRRYVTVHGAVQNPGVYDFRKEMTVRDLVMQAGGLRDDAYVLEAEVARLADVPDETGDLTRIHTVQLDSSYVISESADRPDAGPGGSSGGAGSSGPEARAPEFELKRYDNIFIRRRPGWELQRTVTITGEVRFPGVYALSRKDERLRGVLERAGGLTEEAYAAGIRFFRRPEISAGLGSAAVSGTTDTSDGDVSDGSAANARRAAGDSNSGLSRDTAASDTVSQPTRVNVDLPRVLEEPGSDDNIVLAHGDSIHIPEFSPTVQVAGAVLFPVSVMYEPGAGLGYYISSAGGYARDADPGRVRVEYPNGSIQTVDKWLFFKSSPTPEPGSRVFVPVQPPGEGIDWGGVIRDSLALITGFATIYALLERAN